MMAMRHYMRAQTVESVTDTARLRKWNAGVEQVEEMYRYLYCSPAMKDRFVIPTVTAKWRDAFRRKTAAAYLRQTVAVVPTPNSTCSTAAVLDAIIDITEVRDRAEGE